MKNEELKIKKKKVKTIAGYQSLVVFAFGLQLAAFSCIWLLYFACSLRLEACSSIFT